MGSRIQAAATGIFFVRSIEHQGSLHKCLISRNDTVLQFDMNALHDEEKFKYWAQRTLHRHVVVQHSPVSATIFGSVEVDTVGKE